MKSDISWDDVLGIWGADLAGFQCSDIQIHQMMGAFALAYPKEYLVVWRLYDPGEWWPDIHNAAAQHARETVTTFLTGAAAAVVVLNGNEV